VGEGSVECTGRTPLGKAFLPLPCTGHGENALQLRCCCRRCWGPSTPPGLRFAWLGCAQDDTKKAKAESKAKPKAKAAGGGARSTLALAGHGLSSVTPSVGIVIYKGLVSCQRLVWGWVEWGVGFVECTGRTPLGKAFLPLPCTGHGENALQLRCCFWRCWGPLRQAQGRLSTPPGLRFAWLGCAQDDTKKQRQSQRQNQRQRQRAGAPALHLRFRATGFSSVTSSVGIVIYQGRVTCQRLVWGWSGGRGCVGRQGLNSLLKT